MGKTLHSLKRQSKHQNQTQIWQIVGITRTVISNTMINMLRALMEKQTSWKNLAITSYKGGWEIKFLVGNQDSP